MKKTLTYLAAVALALAAFGGGKTGSEAAGQVSSDPGGKQTFEGEATIDIFGIDSETGLPTHGQVTVGPNTSWEEVGDHIAQYGYSSSTAAQTALMALAKAAYLEAKDEFTQARIDTLADSVQKAFRSLDKIDLRDDVTDIKKTLEKRDRADDGSGGSVYVGGNIFNVAAAQADGKSIASNSQDRLEINGFSGLADAHKGNVLAFDMSGSERSVVWLPIGYYGDGKSIDRAPDSFRESYYNNLSVKGWYVQPPCQESLSRMLTDPNDGENRNAHKILCRVNTGDDAVLHYLPLGDVIKSGGGAVRFVGTEGEAVVGSGSKTNTVTFAKFDDSNMRIKVVSDNNGNATITFGVYYQ